MTKKRESKEEREAWIARIDADIKRVRDLAEKAQAELDAKRAEEEDAA